MRLLILLLILSSFMGCSKTQVRDEEPGKRLGVDFPKEFSQDSSLDSSGPTPEWFKQKKIFRKINEKPRFCYIFTSYSLSFDLARQGIDRYDTDWVFDLIRQKTKDDLQIIFNQYHVFSEIEKRDIEEIVEQINNKNLKQEPFNLEEKRLERKWWTKLKQLDYRDQPPKEKIFYYFYLYQCRNYHYWQNIRTQVILENSWKLDPKKLQTLLLGFTKIDEKRFME